MAISKKGLRTINVNEKKYNWKFNKKVFVSQTENSKSLLIVDFGWYDIFDYLGTKDERPPDFEPKVATPKFVSESIKYARNSGWKNDKMEILYNKGEFKTVS